MKPILVNVDYDEVLTHGRPQASRILALEFLAFWIVRRPIRVHRQYSVDFCDNIEKITGHRPELRTQGPGENWWGALSNLPLETQLNSKIWANQWWRERWSLQGKICHTEAELLPLLSDGREWILKKDHGMSGRGNKSFDLPRWQAGREANLKWLTGGVVAEPLYQRSKDVSALYLPEEGRFIIYQNEIDARFQWRSVFMSLDGKMEFSLQEEAAMQNWSQHLELLAKDIHQLGYAGPFSVDAFFYQENGELKFHPCSEINARKTMGWMAYEFCKMRSTSWGCLFLETQQNPTKLLPSGAILLSPPDASFRWYWLEGSSFEEVKGHKASVTDL